MTITAAGHLDSEEIRSTLASVFADPAYQPGMNFIWDFRDSEGSIDGIDVESIISFVEENKDRRGKGRGQPCLGSGPMPLPGWMTRTCTDLRGPV